MLRVSNSFPLLLGIVPRNSCSTVDASTFYACTGKVPIAYFTQILCIELINLISGNAFFQMCSSMLSNRNQMYIVVEILPSSSSLLSTNESSYRHNQHSRFY